MKTLFPLWKRELQAFYLTALGPLITVFFLIATGTTYWVLASRYAQQPMGGDLTHAFFGSPVFWLILVTLTPLLTMRSLTEHDPQGAMETLMSAPVTATEVVLAKYAGAFTVYILLWAPTATYPFWLWLCGGQVTMMDWGAVITGYLGVTLIGASFLALGLFCSLLARRQLVAAMAGLVLLSLWVSLDAIPLSAHAQGLKSTLAYLSPRLHMADFRVGVMDSRAMVAHVGLTIFLLFSTAQTLEARRWR